MTDCEWSITVRSANGDCVLQNNDLEIISSQTRTEHRTEKIIPHKSQQIHAHKTPYKFLNACIRFLCEKREFLLICVYTMIGEAEQSE